MLHNTTAQEWVKFLHGLRAVRQFHSEPMAATVHQKRYS